MFSKIFLIAVIANIANAAELGHVNHATSYASISSHIQPVHTVHAAPIAHVAHVAHIAPVAHIQHVQHVAPVAHVAHIAHVAPIAHVAHEPVHKEIYADSHPHYSFQYGVHDSHTGDVKNQHEDRDGDVVKGEYSLVQPDGVTRTVHYTADHHNGFNAQVEYKGHASHPQIVHKAIIPTKTIISAPVLHAYH